MTLTIEKTIPMPDAFSALRTERTRVFASMLVGDSFWTSNIAVRNHALTWGRRNGRKLTTRATDCGWRIWRTA